MTTQSIRLDAPDKVLIQAVEGDGLPLEGRIKNLCKGAMQVLAPKVFAPGSQVRLELSHGCLVTGEVMYCYPQQDSYCAVVYLQANPGSECRRHERVAIQDEPAIVALMACAQRCQVTARVIDASKTGIGLHLERRLTVNDWVRVETGSFIVFGDIVHCEPHPAGGYRAGVLIETVIARSIDAAPKRKSTSKVRKRQGSSLMSALSSHLGL